MPKHGEDATRPLLGASRPASPGAVAVAVAPAASSAIPNALSMEMEKHGLTPADQLQLYEEGVQSVLDFKSLSDDQVLASGIDINARRQAKKQRDEVPLRQAHAELVRQERQAHAERERRAQERHTEAKRAQVEQALVRAELSHSGQLTVLTHAQDVDALWQLTLNRQALVQVGLGAMDRQKLENFQAREGGNLRLPTAELVPPLVVPPFQGALTEPELEAQREQQRQRDRAAQTENRENCCFAISFLPILGCALVLDACEVLCACITCKDRPREDCYTLQFLCTCTL